MKIKSVLRSSMLLLLVLTTTTLYAQENAACPAIVQTALQAASAACGDLERNQACYGNVALTAEPQPGVSDFRFEQAGDIVDVTAIRSLALSPLNVETGAWGVALMSLQANIPDTLPGQNVTLLLFGDVTLENATGASAPMLRATTRDNANLRGGPGSTFAIVAQITANTAVSVTGRNAAGDWLRVEVSETGGVRVGWMLGDLLEVEGDLAALPVANADDLSPAQYTPMQAFYFRAGVGDAPCTAAPHSGIMIQTPEGVGEVSLVVNDVNVSLGSTAYLLMVPAVNREGVDMAFSIIEGHGRVEAFGSAIDVPAGSWVRIPIDASQGVLGTPRTPKPYRENEMFVLPTPLLPRAVEVPPALTQELIDAEIGVVQFAAGTWENSVTATANNCGGGLAAPFINQMVLTPDADHVTAEVDYGPGLLNFQLVRTDAATYSASFEWDGEPHIVTLTFTSPTTFSGTEVAGSACTAEFNWTGTFTGS